MGDALVFATSRPPLLRRDASLSDEALDLLVEGGHPGCRHAQPIRMSTGVPSRATTSNEGFQIVQHALPGVRLMESAS